MKVIQIIFFCLIIQSCTEPKESLNKNSLANIDTTFLKNVHWDPLNNFVDYHIIQKSIVSDDTNNNIFFIQQVGFYKYFDKKFVVTPNDTIMECTRKELTDFILSDGFSYKGSLECLLKVNSKIIYKLKPKLLRTITIRPIEMNKENISKLMTSLKEENFVEEATSHIQPLSLIDSMTHNFDQSVLIDIKLKPKYWDLEKVKEICSKLNQRDDIKNTFFGDLYTGVNEVDTFYRLIIKKKSR